MNNPIATYRLQFHKEFTFNDLEKLVPYLKKLGVSTVYASPVFKSTAGSMHGYDGVNPNKIDPEIGSLDTLKLISGKLKTEGMGWLQDIVPNHMAFHSENPWLMDMLEKGTQSMYSTFFDVAWNSRLFQGKLMVPFLGSDLEELIHRGEVKVEYGANRLVVKYEDSVFPINPKSYLRILSDETTSENQAILQIISQIQEAKEIEDPYLFSQRWNEILLQLKSLRSDERVRNWLDEKLAKINGDEKKLRDLIDHQTYALCHWQKTEQQINFRRFFTVNGLICLNIQNEEVFNEYHKLTKTLIDEGVFQGIRIDHIDGLYDPDLYLQQIRELTGEDTYVVVEKILGQDEEMPEKWPIQGTTGYEFLATVNNVLTNASAEKQFTEFYHELTGVQDAPKKQLLKKKAFILYEHMGGELENLFQLFVELNLTEQENIEKPGKENVKNAIGEFLIHCPVYRYYGSLPFEQEEKSALENIFSEIKTVHPQLTEAVVLLESCFLSLSESGDEDYNKRLLEFYHRCMQFTGPIMAKGGEDTLMYTYNRFIGHSDVGDSPESFGLSVENFHKKMKYRKKHWPLSLNTTSTHDTKRGEDVRARLNVLTDLGEDWFSNVREWQKLNASLKQESTAPDTNDEYFIYQNLIGAYPMPGEDDDDFGTRFEEYLQKAFREAKVNTNYTEPNEAYEAGVANFIKELLNKQNPFWERFSAFQEKISDHGIINSLSQLLLKFTCPGIPDVYQGCEMWDLSLVDPDNRRPVDYTKRQNALSDFDNYEDQGRLLEKLWENKNNGAVKLWLTHQLFNLRKNNVALFAEGNYIPLKIEGIYKSNILAFARIHKQSVIVTAVPLNTATLCKEQDKDFFELDWGNTRVILPEGLNGEWENLISGNREKFQHKITLEGLFKNLPVAVLQGTKVDNERNAGILIHITSLVSPFGIGDMGPEAYAFADFLHRSNQKVWQLLPLNPTESSQGNSPYSALSSRAGNPILISPEMLAKDGLLPDVDLSVYHVPETDKADYGVSEKTKMELLEKAYAVFNHNKDASALGGFEKFCDENEEWLEDFSLYMVIRNQHDGKPWIEWEDEFKLRDAETLENLKQKDAGDIRFVKWVQYVFDKQWKALRKYCNENDIEFLGDLPFYVSYNSSDVWAHRDLFLLDDHGKITGVAGVPPDAFSDSGQLWGMPVFDWDALKKQHYQWWIDRLKKNIELFDFVRLDHFRAFADYWVVPGGEETAENGEWKLGPGEEFFETLKNALGSLPFVAEDLGESSPAVYELRDKLHLPGMKVLQFAFEENMPQSEYIPHRYEPNFIAYTGTHDNNTIRGWFRQGIDDETKRRLESYVGMPLSEENIYAVMARLAYSSVAKTAILPIQDVLNLDENSKMNSPGSGEDNWLWRLTPGQITKENEVFLKQLTILFDRD